MKSITKAIFIAAGIAVCSVCSAIGLFAQDKQELCGSGWKNSQASVRITQELTANGNEVFDLSVPETEKLYKEVKASAKPEAYSRDTTSWDEITEGVEAACAAHKGDGIAIISGAYPHIIGALVNLVRRGDVNVEYIPVKGMSISTQTRDSLGFSKNQEFVSEEDLRVQMRRDVGVAKHLGFSDMEEMREFVKNAPHDPAKPTVTFIVANETGLHHLYNSGELGAAHKAADERLTRIVRQSEIKPSFVFFSGEDVNIGGFKDMLSGKGDAHTSTQKFLVDMHKDGLPVEIGAFGHRDRAGHDFGFGMRGFGEFSSMHFPNRPMFGGVPSFSSKGLDLGRILGDSAKKKL